MGELFDFEVPGKFESIYALETDFQNVNTFLCNFKNKKNDFTKKIKLVLEILLLVRHAGAVSQFLATTWIGNIYTSRSKMPCMIRGSVI